MPTDTVTLPSTLQSVIWDLDGTLLDSFGMYRDAVQQVFPKHGRPAPTEETLRLHHHGTMADTIRELAELTGPVTDDEAAALLVDFFVLDNAYITDVEHHLFPDAVRLMERLHAKGVKQVIVTNRPHGEGRGNASPRTMVQNSGLKKYVDQVICGDDVEKRKPHWEVLQASIDSGVVMPVHSLVVGDQYVDAELGHNLGCGTVLVAREGEIPHLDRLEEGWQQSVNIVPNLDVVGF
jgi:phosphoglycolate phosphatase-like HAD superfamily hydrolase